MTLEQIAEIEAGASLAPRMFEAEDGGIITLHAWHDWFAWRPVWTPDRGWVWLKTIGRRFSVKAWKRGGRTVVCEYRRLDPATVRELCRLARLGLAAEKETAGA